jgi:hypothetical protein
MIDSTTASLILGMPRAVQEQFIRYEGGPTDEHRNWFEQNKGKTVQIAGTNMYGVLEKLNEADRGIYNGGRYPYKVRITVDTRTEHSALGMLFEYEPSCLKLVENAEEETK